jgi:hypothetical protein
MALHSGISKFTQRRSRWALLAVGLPAGALLIQPLIAEAQTGVKWFVKKPAVAPQPEPPVNGFATTVRRLMDQARAQAAAGQYDAAVQTAQRARKIADASATVLGTRTDVSVAAADELCQQLITLRDAQEPAGQVVTAPARPSTSPVRTPVTSDLPAAPERPTVVQAIETVPDVTARAIVSPELDATDKLTLEEIARAPLPPVKTGRIPFQPSPIPLATAPAFADDHPGPLSPEQQANEIHTPVAKTPLTPATEHVQARSAYPTIRPRRDLPTTGRTSSLSAGAPLKTGVPFSAGTSVLEHVDHLAEPREQIVTAEPQPRVAQPMPEMLIGTIEEFTEPELTVEPLTVELGEPAPEETVVEESADRMIAEIIATPSSMTERPTTSPVKVILGRSRPLRGPSEPSFAEERTATDIGEGTVQANQPVPQPAPGLRVATVAQTVADPTWLSPEPVEPRSTALQGTPQQPETLAGGWSGNSATVSRQQVTLDDGWSRLGKTTPLTTPTAGDTHEKIDPVGFEQVLPVDKQNDSSGQASPPLPMRSDALEFGPSSTEDLVHRPNVWLREATSQPILPAESVSASFSISVWMQSQLQQTGVKWLTPKVALAGFGVLCITIGMFCVGWATRRSSM